MLYLIKLLALIAAKNRADKALTKDRPRMPSEEELAAVHSAHAKKKLKENAKEKIQKGGQSSSSSTSGKL